MARFRISLKRNGIWYESHIDSLPVHHYYRHVKSSFLTIVVLLLGLNIGVAQQYPFQNYSARDGLLRNAVRTICQDSRGFMWFGTTDGISVYDGATFTHLSTTEGLPHNFINHITRDSSGTIWVATNFAGLCRYRHGALSAFMVQQEAPGSSPNRVNTLLVDRHGITWAGTDGGLFRMNDNEFVAVDTRSFVHDLAEDSAGHLWVGSGVGLLRVDTSNDSVLSVSMLRGMEITKIAITREGNLWLGTTQGLKHLVKSAVGPFGLSLAPLPTVLLPLKQLWIRSLLLEDDVTLWIGTGAQGVFRYTQGGKTVLFAEANGLAGNVVVDIQKDREGNHWFATTTGVSKLPREHIMNFNVTHGLPDHNVQTIAQDVYGNMWFGSRSGLSRLRQGSIRTYRTKDGLAGDYVLSLLQTRDGTLWCGTTGGPVRVTGGDSSPSFIKYGSARGWKDKPATGNRARAMYQDDEGNLWVGSDLGINILRHGKFETLPVEGTFEDTLVSALVRDNAGDLWAGLHSGGVLRFRVERKNGALQPRLIERYAEPEGMADRRIRCGMKDSEGRLWFGTRFGGVSRFVVSGAHVEITNFTTDNGLSSNNVNDILEDARNNLWFATDKGVDRVIADTSGLAVIDQITLVDGLAGDGALAVYEDRDGFLWFATLDGVTKFDPDATLSPAPPPPVYITKFEVFGVPDQAVLQVGKAELAYDQHSVAFEYVGISFRDERKVRYRYMLAGLDSAWSAPTDRRYANYTHLPPGEYVFLVRARNGDGTWSTEPARFLFTIASPFWATWWFVTVAMTCLLLLVWIIHHFRVKQLLELERVRARISADLHDDIGSTLGSISIFSEMAARELTGTAPRAIELLGRIGEDSRAMIESLDDIVWSINPRNDSLEDILLRIREHSAEVLEAKDISLSLDLPVDARRVRLPMEKRRHFYLIFKEALNNIVRHAACSSVWIGVDISGDALSLTIKDDGCGFDVTTGHSGNGLRSMQHRAGLIGAELNIQTSGRRGTTVVVSLRVT